MSINGLLSPNTYNIYSNSYTMNQLTNNPVGNNTLWINNTLPPNLFLGNNEVIGGGVKGKTGVTGITGATGPINDIGGRTGPTGNTGIIGSTGGIGSITGNTGPTGLTGNAGSTGLTGVSGATATSGITGHTGNTGVTGVIGITGATEPSGITGVTGGTGSTGSTGPTGSLGLLGATGVSDGNAGATGSTGPTGPTGVSLSTVDLFVNYTGPNGQILNTTGDTLILFPNTVISSPYYVSGGYNIPETGIYTFVMGVGFSYQLSISGVISVVTYGFNLSLTNLTQSNTELEQCKFANTLYYNQPVNYHTNLSFTYSGMCNAGDVYAVRSINPSVSADYNYKYLNVDFTDAYFQVTRYI